MKLVHYCIINKKTAKAVYVNCRKHKVEEYLETLPNKEEYGIGSKRVSI